MPLHHTRKGSQTERGSSALRGAADTMIEITGGKDVLTVRVDKQRDGKIGRAHV